VLNFGAIAAVIDFAGLFNTVNPHDRPVFPIIFGAALHIHQANFMTADRATVKRMGGWTIEAEIEANDQQR
jgi:hypothetical protein